MSPSPPPTQDQISAEIHRATSEGRQPIYFVPSGSAVRYSPNSGYIVIPIPSNPSNPNAAENLSDLAFTPVFQDRSVRQKFLQKVYGILAAQILATALLVGIFVVLSKDGTWFRDNIWIFWLSVIVNMAVLFSLTCFRDVHKKPAVSLVLLAIFTLTESVLLGFISAMFQINEVLFALVLTSGIFLVLTLFAFQTRFDLTKHWVILLVLLILLIIVGLVAVFMKDKTVSIIYVSLGVFVMSIYLIVDTQLLMIGSREVTFGPEDYILAALHLYMDIVLIFLYILQIIGLTRD